jgi:kynurenine formamidase
MIDLVKRRVVLLAMVIGMAALTGTAFAQDDWYPSRFGEGDTLGAANLLTPDKVRDAAKLVKTGKTYSLGVEVSRETPAYAPRSFQLFAVAGGDGSGGSLGSNKATYNDDWIMTWLGIGTQLDGLGHLGINHHYYNGAKLADFWQADGLTKLSTADVPPIVTRGVLLDIAGLRGEKMLAAGTAINRAEIDEAAKKQNVALQEGDVVILSTGWQALATSDPEKFMMSEPGLGKEGAEYLAKLGVVAVGADTWGVETVPAEDANEVFPVHQILLAKYGVYILENIKTDELIADKAWEFLFVLGQAKMKGAVQMMINPIAIR